ncbi:hypothetical protein CFC21_055023 [Triticum aestivum]|uniref:Uncharacterized protein n=4 Tax=Triticum aestivum TaxID=4565 RepID=A0A9R1GG09_WHEAT|nr:hypothetical protein CFC21_055015 [Triticum aestivum]KAF7045962.1 hypothetical protein CFC21_055023 [Triticum aestivum]
MAGSALKMAAICAVLVILLSGVGQPAMAYVDGLACPSAATPCRADCFPVCNDSAPLVCNKLCGLTPSGLGVVDKACVDHFFTACMAICKNMCEP